MGWGAFTLKWYSATSLPAKPVSSELGQSLGKRSKGKTRNDSNDWFDFTNLRKVIDLCDLFTVLKEASILKLRQMLRKWMLIHLQSHGVKYAKLRDKKHPNALFFQLNTYASRNYVPVLPPQTQYRPPSRVHWSLTTTWMTIQSSCWCYWEYVQHINYTRPLSVSLYW